MKKGFITTSLVLALSIISPFAATGAIRLQAADQIYENIEEVPIKDAALVLGAAAYPYRLSDMLQDRVDTAIELYQLGKVNKLIMSGGAHEASSMKEYAIEQGIPAEAIVEDPNGANTLASFQNTDETSLIIVTQAYHLPRSIYIASSMNIDAVGVAADKQPYVDIEAYQKREFLAINKAVLDVLMGQGIR